MIPKKKKITLLWDLLTYCYALNTYSNLSILNFYLDLAFLSFYTYVYRRKKKLFLINLFWLPQHVLYKSKIIFYLVN